MQPSYILIYNTKITTGENTAGKPKNPMNKILEQSIALLAPHRCISCSLEGSLLCYGCEALLQPVFSRCYRCHKVTRQSAVCSSCRSSVKLSHVWISAEYEDLAKKLLYKLKFGRAKNGAERIAELMSVSLPYLPADVAITHLPTANHRVRARGYDQAALITRHLAKKTNLNYQNLFYRIGKSRQVGSSRKERFAHLEKALQLHRNAEIKGKHILVVDDVTTTGATIETAAKILKENGAKTVDAAVFAQPQ